MLPPKNTAYHFECSADTPLTQTGYWHLPPFISGRRVLNVYEYSVCYYQRINLLSSRRSRESHETYIAIARMYHPAANTRRNDDKRGRSDAPSARFARSA